MVKTVVQLKDTTMFIDVGFIADLHFGHENLIKNKRGFETVEEHDNLIITNWNKVCTKKSLIFIPGDIAMENLKHYHLLDKLLGRKVVIGGNHDVKQHTTELLKHVESIIGCLEYKGFIVTHIPIHTSEIHRFRGNIHGHIHEERIKAIEYQPFKGTAVEMYDDRYYNCSAEIIDYTPKSLNQLIEINKTLNL